MKTGCCEGCGAPLLAEADECIYCLRAVADEGTPLGNFLASVERTAGRYELGGFTDWRGLYGHGVKYGEEIPPLKLTRRSARWRLPACIHPDFFKGPQETHE